MSNDRIHAFWAKCGDDSCGHAWPATYLPMDMALAAAIMKRATCPMCGNRKPTVAKQEQGELLETSGSNLLEILTRSYIERTCGLLDDGMRTTPGYAADELSNQGRVGLVDNLRRLQQWLDRVAMQEPEA